METRRSAVVLACRLVPGAGEDAACLPARFFCRDGGMPDVCGRSGGPCSTPEFALLHRYETALQWHATEAANPIKLEPVIPPPNVPRTDRAAGSAAQPLRVPEPLALLGYRKRMRFAE